ncbi:MAG: hypothetical protein AAGC74_03550 [Verrucomicrobiota bacterium]
MIRICVSLVFLGLATVFPVAAEVALPRQEGGAVVEDARFFRQVGSYRISGGSLVKGGQANPILMDGVILEVFTDGIDLRIRPRGSEESYIEFQIYRDGGIFDESGKNLLPGVQAFSDQGGVVRHLCLAQDRLTLTKFPASSTDLQITYALRDES